MSIMDSRLKVQKLEPTAEESKRRKSSSYLIHPLKKLSEEEFFKKIMCGVTVIVCKSKEKCKELSNEFMEDQKKRGPDFIERVFVEVGEYNVCIIASVLWIRGAVMQKQPVKCKNDDVFAWNGEMYNLSKKENETSDTLILAERLEEAESVCDVISNVEGPFAMIYLRRNENSLYFARNEYGQRSLLIALPTALKGENVTNEADHSIGTGEMSLTNDDFIIVSSVAPKSLQTCAWKEIPVIGVYKLEMKKECIELNMVKTYQGYKNRISSPPTKDLLKQREQCQSKIFELLCKSVEKRVSSLGELKNVRLLFSGGVDSLLLAVLMHKYAPKELEISLRNVSFGEGESFDRKQAKIAVKELERLFPERKWKLDCVDVDKVRVRSTMENVKHITYPQNTVMDITIGTVLWFAFGDEPEDYCKVVFTGIGADELFGGYKRHVSKFKQKGTVAMISFGCFDFFADGWKVLESELISEISRIAYRNNGRDDRICGSFSKEGRHPFLDHDLCHTAMTCPLDLFMDLSLQDREGGKLILREILRDMGFCKDIWNAPKKAMQFGSQMNKVFKKFFDGKKTTGTMTMKELE